jgi:hypothetical protein
MASNLLRTMPALAVGLALGANAPAARAADPDDPYKESVPVPLRAAPDDLSGHLVLAPHLAYLVPTGSAEDGFKQRGYTGSGLAYGLNLSFGMSRYVALQGRFETASLPKGDGCPTGGTCSARSTAIGLGVEYHLVNGAAFDPWLSAGVGYRMTSFDLSWAGYDPGSLEFKGFDSLHVAIGGEWYPTSMIGFGPFLSLDIGTYGVRPGAQVARPRSTDDRGVAIHSFLSVGMRATFDWQR